MDDKNSEERLKVAKAQRDRYHKEGGVSHEFENLAEFKTHALSGAWDPEQDRIHISNIPYKLAMSQPVDWIKVLKRGQPLVAIYRQPGAVWNAEGKKTGLGPWVVIVWRKYNGNIFKPSAVFSTRAHAFKSRIKDSIGTAQDSRQLGEAATPEERKIGSTAMLKITSLPQSGEMKARVDTGATISSIHCDRWKVNGESVEFVSKALSPNVITLPLVTHQATRTSDGGTENRPVIELNVRINGEVMQGVQFNLNNRQHMEYPALIGQNVLQKGKFLIDPSMVSESEEEDDEELNVDWDSLMEELEPMLTESAQLDINTPDGKLIDMMMKSEMSLSDVVAACRRLEYAGADK